ncbi:hypothetical protein AB0O07_23370 [Streptomyces sp. NPDC093085]|uniref:DUF7544 domain-containing protein n=1 Tax=Streptomyces sp. NPDC093085 TaxID=3155068 RepID=UPI003441EB2A
MNDTPGWASPGSAPSDGQDTTVPRPAEPADNTDTPAKWSATQPPPGEWSAPSTPGHGPTAPRPAQNWGGPPPGGPHGGGWGAPPAAKPGVIPLRPLSVGEILDGAVSTLRVHWRTVLSVSLVVSVIAQIGDILLRRYLVPAPFTPDPNAPLQETLAKTADSAQAQLTADIPSLALMMVCTLFTTAILTVVISRSVLGRPVTLAEAWQEARPRIPRLLGFTLLLALMSVAVLTVCMLPGVLIGSVAGVALALLGAMAAFFIVIWLMVRFSLTSPALMLERQGIIPSMRRSAKLVSGAWWRTFGVLALTLLLSFLLTFLIAIPFAAVSRIVAGDTLTGWPFLIITGIGAVIASTITYPISAGVTVLLYVDQRIRREALDLELARAAGIPGYGTARPDHGPSGS